MDTPPRTAAKSWKDGTQPVKEYRYPTGEPSPDGDVEWVYRSGRVSNGDPNADGQIEVEHTDGLGCFPVHYRGNAVFVTHAQVPHHRPVQLQFSRPSGTTGPYVLDGAFLQS